MMKNLLKKLHIVPASEDTEGSPSSKTNKSSGRSSPERPSREWSHHIHELKPLSNLSAWLSSGAHRHSHSPPSFKKEVRMEIPSSASSESVDVSVEVESSDLNPINPGEGEMDEEYQIQLALEMSASEDPEAFQIEAVKQISLGRSPAENTPAEILSFRYLNYDALDYDDKILDGFYDIYNDAKHSTSKSAPSILDLQTELPPSKTVCWEAILVDRVADTELSNLECKALLTLGDSKHKQQELPSADTATRLALFVSDLMGGQITDADSTTKAWKSLKATLGTPVLPLGSLTVGLSRHRALLFKVLADAAGIPCRLVKEQHSGGSDAVVMNFVRADNGSEYIVDLTVDPGMLIPSDKALASTSSTEPPRPLPVHVHGRSPSWTEGVSSPTAREMRVKDVSQYMINAAKENPKLAQKLHDVLLESGVLAPPDLFRESYSEHFDVARMDREYRKTREIARVERELHHNRFLPPLPHQDSTARVKLSPCVKNIPVAAAAAAAAAAVVASSMVAAAANDELPLATATAAAVVATAAVVSKHYGVAAYAHPDSDSTGSGDQSTPHDHSSEGGDKWSGDRTPPHDHSSDKWSGGSAGSDAAMGDVADCEIAWEEITLGDRVGLGSYGEVYRGDWHGTEVAVKKFLHQDISGESLEEFRTEVRIMKRLRHPNVVLFMGAVTRSPNFSILTEFLHRGSLYRLIHRCNSQLDERRRMRMALDTARGMTYLHSSTPVIVHRDLKSPNLLVDKNWVVKVCDFGLSRIKNSTFLSSKSNAGTAEWMAPEVLRNEPSNEKCDVYSFGVILWELSTLQQPWGGLNPMQVVGAVGFQHRRLDIPDDVDPTVADIILKCWHTDPKMRPTFSEIMAALRPLQKPITGSSSSTPKRRAP